MRRERYGKLLDALGQLGRRRMKIRVLIGCVITLVVASVCLYEPVKIRYLARRVEKARTPKEEAEAFRMVWAWSDYWVLSFFDQNGAYLKPNDTDPNRKVAYIQLRWPNGVTAKRRLRDPDNRYILMRE